MTERQRSLEAPTRVPSPQVMLHMDTPPSGQIPHAIEDSVAPNINHISRLPNELLRQVFVDLFTPGCINPAQSAKRSSHVCRHWRQVALSTPLLWTCFNLNEPCVAEELFRRSYPLPVKISYCGPGSRLAMISVVNTILPHVSRIGSLIALIEHRSGLRYLINRLQDPAPMLRKLALKSSPDPSTRHRREGLRVAVPFGGETPALRSLSLGPVTFDLVSTANLTSLNLEKMLPPLPVILDLLERSPLLEEFFLYQELPPYTTDVAVSTERKIALPSLRTLSLDITPSSTTVVILSYLSLPGRTTFGLAGESVGASVGHPLFPHDTSALATLPRIARLQLSQSLEKGSDWPRLCTMRGFGPASPLTGRSLVLDATVDCFAPAGLGPCLSIPFDAANVRALHVSGFHGVAAERWAPLLEALPALAHVRLSDIGEGLVHVLVGLACEERVPGIFCPTRFERSGNGERRRHGVFRRPKYCKKLRLIQIEGACWRGAAVPALEKVVALRSRIGESLDRVELMDGGFSEEVESRLGGVPHGIEVSVGGPWSGIVAEQKVGLARWFH